VSQRQLVAICLWILAWYCAGLIVVAWFAARDGKRATARAELAIGLAGAAGLGWAGAALW
jgi:hypothetical protein